MIKYDEFIDRLKNDIVYRNAIAELCKADFLCYLKTVFYIINSSYFLLKPFHKVIARKLQSIVEQRNEKRNLALCLPVGSGKSLIVEYFITWCFARSVNNAFIYVSHASLLITKLSKESRDIVCNPIWQLLFNHYLKADDRQKINYSFDGAKNRTGLTAGTMGGDITGLDAGNPNIKGFSGALIIDDPVDAGDIKHENARNEVIQFYNGKLKTRRRTPQTPTILIMQRLHVEDLVGWIEKNEPEIWDIVVVKALENGKSFWAERYPIEELEHIERVDNYNFQAQYQQNPIIAGGSVIKREWFKYYDISQEYKYKRIVMASDTAMSTKESADRSVVMVGGVTQNNQLHIIDYIAGRWDYPELKKRIIALWNKWQFDRFHTSASALFVEEKASGIQVLQELRQHGIPVRPLKADKDKVTRVESVLDYIASGQVFLPSNENYGYNPDILNECESFTRDMSQAHDDVTDTLVWLLKSSIAHKQVSILEVL